MQSQDLQDLILLAKAKNQKAQTQLINLLWVDVFMHILKSTQNEMTADEITVSTFSKVLNKLETYKPEYPFKTWVFRIAHNTLIDYYRKQNGLKETSLGGNELKNQFADSPEEILISHQEHQRIIKIIDDLDENYKKIIQLRFYEEKSINEIAEELQISISNTKIRIMRAKKILTKILKQDNV